MPRHYRRRYKKKSTKAIAYKALKLAKKINKGIEMKFIDTQIVTTFVNWLGTPLSTLNNPQQGLSDNERVGDSIQCSSVRWKAQYINNISRGSYIRSILFWDKFNTVNAPSDVLEVTGSAQSILSDYTVDKRHDYIIVSDTIHNCDGTRTFVSYQKKRKKLNKKTQFAAGTVTIEKGVLKHFCISDLDPSASPQLNFQMFFRVYYMDL